MESIRAEEPAINHGTIRHAERVFMYVRQQAVISSWLLVFMCLRVKTETQEKSSTQVIHTARETKEPVDEICPFRSPQWWRQLLSSYPPSVILRAFGVCWCPFFAVMTWSPPVQSAGKGSPDPPGWNIHMCCYKKVRSVSCTDRGGDATRSSRIWGELDRAHEGHRPSRRTAPVPPETRWVTSSRLLVATCQNAHSGSREELLPKVLRSCSQVRRKCSGRLTDRSMKHLQWYQPTVLKSF